MRQKSLLILLAILIITCSSPTKHSQIDASLNILYPENSINNADLEKIVFNIETEIAFDGVIKLYINDELNRTQEYYFDTIPSSQSFYLMNAEQLETYGEHKLTLKLFDSSNKSLDASEINISKTVFLYQPIYENTYLNICWDKYQNSDFEKYILFKSENSDMNNAKSIFTATNIDDNKFFDSEISNDERKYYQLFTIKESGDTIQSNIVLGSTFEKIIYVAYQNENTTRFDIFSVDIDGNNINRLTETYESEHLPSFSSDGNDIIYGDGNSILKMNIGGHSKKDFNLESSSEPKYSSDQSKIIYLSQQDGNSDIFIMDSSGNNQQNLTNTEEHEWEYDIASNTENIIYSDLDDIYIMDYNGNNKKNLTNNEEQCTNPIFSNDDQSIYYYSNSDLYKMDIDGSNKVNLTDEFDEFVRSPDLSPTQNEIVCYSADGIYIINIETKNVIQISSDNRAFDPVFSLNGDKIAYYSEGNIYLIDSDGSNKIALTKNSSLNNQHPIFRPKLNN